MRIRTSIVLAVAGVLTVAAAPAVDVTGSADEGGETAVVLVEDETQFNLRRDGCGSGTANYTYLSVTSGEDSGDGCGTIGGVAPLVNEVAITVEDSRVFTDAFPADDGLPLTVDAARDISGKLTFGQFKGISNNPASFGGGEMQVEFKLTGLAAGFKSAFEVTTVGSALALPGDGTYEVPFTFDLPDTAQGVEIVDLTLELVVRGVNAGQDYLHTSNGVSNFVLPTLVEETTTAG